VGLATSAARLPERPDSSEFGRGVAVALAAAALYWTTLAPGLLWGDDAELQRLAWVGSDRTDAHSHPLWSALAHVVAGIPIGSIAWRTNLMSAVCAAIAVGILYLAAVRLTRNRAASALAALAFAVSHTHWLHAVRTEVYALFGVLLSLVLLIFAAWRERQRAWQLPLLGLTAGVALLSHQLIVMALPGLALGVWWSSPRGRRVRNLVALAAGGLVGLAVYVAVSGVDSFVHPVHGGGGPLSIFTVPRVIDIVRCVVFVAYQFPLSGPLLLWGAWRMWHDDVALAATLTAIALGDLGFALCFRVPDQYVFYLPSYFVLALFLAWGLRSLGQPWLRAGVRRVALAAVLVLAPPALYRLAPLVASATHIALVTPRTLPGRDNNLFFMFPPKQRERSAERFARGAFAVLPESALVIADWAPLEPLRYLQEVEHERLDLTFVESDPRDRGQVAWMAEQARHRPVCIADDEPAPYYDLVSLRQHFDIRPLGPVFRLVPRGE
jgi:hypothetical protein